MERRDKGVVLILLQTGPQGLSQETVWLDATISESLQGSVEWTEHPVEDGAPITDHGTLGRMQLDVSGSVTETPLDASEQRPGRMQDVEARLWSMLRARQELIVFSGRNTWSPFVISSLSISRSPSAAELQVDLSLVEIVRVTAQTVEIPPQYIDPELLPGMQPGSDAVGYTPLTDEEEAAIAEERLQAMKKEVADEERRAGLRAGLADQQARKDALKWPGSP